MNVSLIIFYTETVAVYIQHPRLYIDFFSPHKPD